MSAYFEVDIKIVIHVAPRSFLYFSGRASGKEKRAMTKPEINI